MELAPGVLAAGQVADLAALAAAGQELLILSASQFVVPMDGAPLVIRKRPRREFRGHPLAPFPSSLLIDAVPDKWDARVSLGSRT